MKHIRIILGENGEEKKEANFIRRIITRITL